MEIWNVQGIFKRGMKETANTELEENILYKW